MTDPMNALVDRYVAQWNEPDAATRRTMVRDLWSPGGGQILADPPEAARAQAADLRFATPSFEVHGHEALDARVTRAHEMFVATGAHRFEADRPVDELLPRLVTFGWRMVSTSDGSDAGRGVEVLDLDDDGRIRRDYQFIGR
jgi:uncharacterized heparinase superfamily protein